MVIGHPDSSNLTTTSCITICKAAGYSVAGTEYSTQCFCDNFLRNGAPIAVDGDCNMACAGISTESCGGPNRLSVYSNQTLKVLPIPTPKQTDLPGAWKYVGCLTDNATGNRTFPYQIIYQQNNTASVCLSRCSEYGFGAAGMEYGDECYCGDASDIIANGATIMPETDCKMPCPGDGSTICGDGNRITYYKWTGAPLNSWDFPQGAGAGKYEFLIGGVVVPLITTQGINGKVTFVEKSGTGPPNSTGAYELDLTQINNFTAAWRTMHFKTDVFCSSSLTLPDRLGRQINIGGWSANSLFGVRLYTPDGSPGQTSLNDWQENVANVSLQTGRWYPSAMLMANGSILVVGGENGSNGPAVPSLELLPRTGPVMFMEWLNRTDPNNLYPFLSVLPSGGIFVGYYNEARILDEQTFATTTVLQNMPGAVHNPLGGRTYPLEGALMHLPQKAPYTDPLGILICGGSTPFEGNAIDNCISIQPEVPNASWVIERMPSKRVMACMTALPDGTYLILNGGKKGVAGFGLGKMPNLNAVLYDPSKPINQRMSVMQNTTIARMYHSESILLQDGRILVSGSDPEDTDFPQEYRIEVFSPPYLLTGGSRPTFTLGAQDWAYNAQISFTVTSGNAATIQVSLLGAESSTHGNSMGQRTIFPEFSCRGNQCTVVAPPNAHVCPAGWFQMFVLQDGVPSLSQFVRIGGDPGQLGNWPIDPAFGPLPGMGGIRSQPDQGKEEEDDDDRAKFRAN